MPLEDEINAALKDAEAILPAQLDVMLEAIKNGPIDAMTVKLVVDYVIPMLGAQQQAILALARAIDS